MTEHARRRNHNFRDSARPKTPEVGTRVELIELGQPDEYTRLKPGVQGIVEYIDDADTVHVKWETGSSLGLLAGVDRFKVIK